MHSKTHAENVEFLVLKFCHAPEAVQLAILLKPSLRMILLILKQNCLIYLLHSRMFESADEWKPMHKTIQDQEMHEEC